MARRSGQEAAALRTQSSMWPKGRVEPGPTAPCQLVPAQAQRVLLGRDVAQGLGVVSRSSKIDSEGVDAQKGPRGLEKVVWRLHILLRAPRLLARHATHGTPPRLPPAGPQCPPSGPIRAHA